MALYAQHGHGKSAKITTALDDGDINGVIFAPRNEKRTNLSACVQQLSDAYDCELLVDPQLYVATFNPANLRYLEEYPYFTAGMSASDFSLRSIRRIAKEAIDFQLDMPVTAVLSPTVMFDSFSDRWYQIALNLAEAALEHHGTLSSGKPLLLSFAFSEAALVDEEEIGRFLDTVTKDDWSMDGFYFVVDRADGGYSQEFDATRLANYLYLVHILGKINDLRVVAGYSDLIGLLLRAAGAEAFATGWSQGLRQFARKNFLLRRPGGQPPRDRYTSGPLLNSILLQELQDIFEVGHMRTVLSGAPLDSVLREAENPLAAEWSQAISQRHHWQVLRRLDGTLTGDTRHNVLEVLKRIRAAQGIYTILDSNGVRFQRTTGRDHLANWGRAFSEFVRRAGLESP